MIGDALGFVRKQLDAYLRDELGGGHEPSADKVVFVDGDKLEPLVFTEGAVSELLVNVEEERQLRQADPYMHLDQAGKPQRKQPDVRLALYVMFVARFKQYDAAWNHLSKVIEYLQLHPTIDRAGSPDLPPGIDRLSFELVTQSFAEQSDVWSVLKTGYHPSVLYRTRMVIVRDAKPVTRDQITHDPPIVVVEHYKPQTTVKTP